MTEEEYTRERNGWLSSIYSIPRRRHFPRCVRYRLVQLAKLEASYFGSDEKEKFTEIKEKFMDI